MGKASDCRSTLKNHQEKICALDGVSSARARNRFVPRSRKSVKPAENLHVHDQAPGGPREPTLWAAARPAAGILPRSSYRLPAAYRFKKRLSSHRADPAELAGC